MPEAARVARVVAVVVSWRQASQLPACLAALEAQTHPDLAVVVVDNASGDGSVELLEAAAATPRRHPLHVVANDVNVGFSAGVHAGLRAAPHRADAVWLVNVDTVPEPDHLAVLVAALEADPRCAAVQGRLLRAERGPDGIEVVDSTGIEATSARLFRDRDEGRPAAAPPRSAGEVFGVTGACSLHRTVALEDVAWPDGTVLTEPLFAYFEDVELAWRYQRFGWRCRHVPGAVATHERGGAGPRRTPFVEELNLANRLLVLAIHDGWRTVGRAWPTVVVTTLLKGAELVLTVPTAALPSLRRLRRGWGAARARHGQLAERARVPAEEVLDRWFGPMWWRAWVTTWWKRVRGRAPGVAPAGRGVSPRR